MAVSAAPGGAGRIGEILRAERRGVLRQGAAAAAVGAAVLASGWYTGLFDLRRLAEGIPALFQLFGDMLPPDFSRIGKWWQPLLDTLALSIAGTALAVLVALPLAMLAARNTSPHPLLYGAARTVMNALRSVPELIMGIVFVAAVGFGALPGVLALGIHSIGMVGKLFAESIEHVDLKPVEAARAAGAGRLQVIRHAVLPQVLPQLADIAVYRWEYNFRASTVLGMVGAGGIGFELMSALRILQYRQVFALLITILVMVTAVDALGARLRRHLQ